MSIRGNCKLEVTVLENNPNRQVSSFLDAYLGDKRSVGFAVLLDGGWGVGKTHFLNRYFDERIDNVELEHIYVSLYGLTSVSEIQNSILTAAITYSFKKNAEKVSKGAGRVFGQQGMKLAGSVASSLAKLGGVSDIKLDDIVSIPPDLIIVIDDLERCAMNIHDAMGQLNGLVEHGGHKMIILANEAAVPEEQKQNYSDRKEKLIGQTLSITSDFDAAYSYYLSEITDRSLVILLLKKRDEIEGLFLKSEVESLRILEQSIWQFERLYTSLPTRVRNCAGGIGALLKQFLLLSFEYRSGRIDADQIQKRPDSENRGKRNDNVEGQEGGFEFIQQKYSDCDIFDHILPNSVFCDLLVNGFIDAEVVTNELLRHPSFSEVAPPDAWTTVWQSYESTEKEFLEALKVMNSNFQNGIYREPSEVLQVSLLRCWFAKKNMLSSVDENSAIVEASKYVKTCNFQYENVGHEWSAERDNMTDFSYFSIGTPLFSKLSLEIKNRLDKINLTWKTDEAKRLLELLKVDFQGFSKQIVGSDQGVENLDKLPILASICPREFVVGVLSHDAAYDHVFAAIFQRATRPATNEYLQPEREWVRRVIEEIEIKIKELSRFRAYHLEHCCDRYLKCLIS